MSFKNIKIKSLLNILGSAIAINCVVGALVPVNAQPNSDRERNNRESTTITNNGLPSHRRDGGTRSSCLVNSQEFVALVPDKAVSLTASSNPKLYFHVPQTNQSQTIEFVLRDRQDRLIYEILIETKGRAGIMSVEIPFSLVEQAKSVGDNTDYLWYLSNICNPEKRSQDIVLQGWIERVQLSEIEREKLAELSPIDRANFYQQQGIWHDALNIAANQLKTQPENILETQWSELLNQIDLEKFVTKPIID